VLSIVLVIDLGEEPVVKTRNQFIIFFLGFGLLTLYIYSRKAKWKRISFFSGIVSLLIMIAFLLLAFKGNSYSMPTIRHCHTISICIIKWIAQYQPFGSH